MDVEVGQILQDLEEAEVADNTIVFFWTDHGISHLRGKQFLYDAGIRVPLITLFGDRRYSGRTRKDLVLQIDVAATSLALAGIPIPDYVQGRDLFADDYRPRKMIFSARDRCDETVDVIRCVRTRRYKYIRNFIAHMSHAQPNQYKDGKAITQTMRKLHQEGGLDELQSRVFAPKRPVEEFYDLENDPYETVNLAGQPQHQEALAQLRKELYAWMIRSRDLGLIPEPILEELGKQYENKYSVLQKGKDKSLVQDLIKVIEAAERGDTKALYTALVSREPAIRYWAATGLGNLGHRAAIEALSRGVCDPSAAVRIAAALALCRLGQGDKHIQTIIDQISNSNLIVGMYAIRALELSGVDCPSVRQAVETAKVNPYEFTRRIANRLSAKFGA